MTASVSRVLRNALIVALALTAAPACKSSHAQHNPASETPPSEAANKKETRVTVLVTEKGYQPNSVEAAANAPLTLVFKRTSDKGCGTEVVFPKLGIKKPLPLNQEVEIKLTPQKDESIAFTCGMGMYRGSVVVTR